MGPSLSGIFRCDNIETMRPDNVFLGNINGLWTNPMTLWENYRTEEPQAYDTVLKQYKNQLISGVEYLKSQIYDSGINRSYIERYINREFGVQAKFDGISLTPNKMNDLTIDINGDIIHTKCLILKEGREFDFLLPENFRIGENPANNRQMGRTGWIDIFSKELKEISHSIFTGIKIKDAPKRENFHKQNQEQKEMGQKGKFDKEQIINTYKSLSSKSAELSTNRRIKK